MKKSVLFLLLMLLCSCKCIVAGDLSENRKRMHEMGNEEEYCIQNPDKCVKGVKW